jgi:hypothetical protein
MNCILLRAQRFQEAKQCLHDSFVFRSSGTMLRLVGRFDRLGIDTSCRSVFKEQLNEGKKASDDEIDSYYQPFGAKSGLALWMDVMRVNLKRNIAAASGTSRLCSN